MALPRKRSRRFTVDGMNFRYAVAAHSTGPHTYLINLKVTRDPDIGSSLLVQGTVPDGPGRYYPDVILMPRDVEKIIRRAMAGDWQPNEPGSNVRLHNLEELIA